MSLLEMEWEKQALEEAMEKCRKELGAQQKGWKSFPAIVKWKLQYENMMHRYQFLVLEGPSRMGKTVYARSLASDASKALEINCSAGTEPDLRAYRLSRHSVIIFDEISPIAVMKQRKLFQACAVPVQLGCSATNCHSKEVFLHRNMIFSPHKHVVFGFETSSPG